MGVLTVTMTGLRDQIVSSRQARVALRGDLVRQTGERRLRVSALCAGFARDRAGAHRAWFGPKLVEGQTAERPQPRRHEPAPEPVSAPAAQPSTAPLPRAKGRFFKGFKKH
jgi:hypothetical protein